MSAIAKTASVYALLIQLGPAPGAEEIPPELPDTVVIHADDPGCGDVNCYNAERGRFPTPHIDKLTAAVFNKKLHEYALNHPRERQRCIRKWR